MTANPWRNHLLFMLCALFLERCLVSAELPFYVVCRFMVLKLLNEIAVLPTAYSWEFRKILEAGGPFVSISLLSNMKAATNKVWRSVEHFVAEEVNQSVLKTIS